MKSKEKISVSLNAYDSWVLKNALQRYDLGKKYGRPWFIKWAIRAFSIAVCESENEFHVPPAVDLRAETREESDRRIQKGHELEGFQGELFDFPDYIPQSGDNDVRERDEKNEFAGHGAMRMRGKIIQVSFAG